MGYFSVRVQRVQISVTKIEDITSVTETSSP